VQPPHRPGPLLPTQYAFVVQFAAETTAGQGWFVGRVEHMVSGQAQRFHTLEELLAFMTRVLSTLEARRPEVSQEAPPPPCDPAPSTTSRVRAGRIGTAWG